MRRRLLFSALVVSSLSCERAPEAIAPADMRPIDAGPAYAVTSATLLPTDTIAKAAGVKVDTIDLAGLPHDRFMAPYRLYVTDLGAGLTGSISVDGEFVLRLGAVPPGGSTSRRIAVTPTSRVVVRLGGDGPRALALRIGGVIQRAPVIRITSPARGAMRRGGSSIEVRGEACHGDFPIVALSVNGIPQSVTGSELCAPFRTAVASPWGLTTVVVEATNAAGRSARRVHSFLRSSHYSAPALMLGDASYDSTVDVGRAAVVRYEQPGLQKLNALIPQALVNGQTIGAGFPAEAEIGSCNASAGFIVTRESVESNIDGVTVSVANANRLNVRIQYDLTIRLNIEVCGFFSDEGDGTITVSNAFMDGNVDFGIFPGSGGVDVRVGQVNNTHVSSDNVSISLNPVLTPGIEILVGQLVDFTEEMLAADAITLLTEAAQVGHAFQRLQLPGDRLRAIGVDLAHTAELMTLANGGANVSFRAQAAPLVPRGGSAPTRGSIRSAAGLSLLPRVGDVNEFVSDDFVNQVLWSAWQAGHFDMPDLEAFATPIAGVEAEAYSQLPPVMMPAAGARVRFGWGDVRVVALVDPARFGLPGSTTGAPVEVSAFGSVMADGRMLYDSVAHRLVLRVSAVAAEVELASPPSALLDEVALREALAIALEQAARNRLDAVVDVLPLPEADLTSMLGVPAGTTLDLHNAIIARAGRFHRMGGSISF